MSGHMLTYAYTRTCLRACALSGAAPLAGHFVLRGPAALLEPEAA